LIYLVSGRKSAQVNKSSIFADLIGEVAERLIAPVLKTGLGKTNGGSNPSLSAEYIKMNPDISCQGFAFQQGPKASFFNSIQTDLWG
jgi:hypothetical protein